MIRVWLVVVFVLTELLPSLCQQQLSGRVHAEMHNIDYHFSDSITVHISDLQGDLVPAGTSQLPIFDDANSFTLEIHAGELMIAADAMADALNRYAFSAHEAPLKHIHVSTQNGKIKIQGRLHSKGDIPFESEGSLSVTPQGEILVHTDKVKAAHLPVKGLMDLLGENIAKMIDTRKVHGVRAEKDDLILTPAELFPPPHIQGALSSIAIRGNNIVLRYGSGAPSAPTLQGNYMAYRGAQLRFGKLTMSDTDLTLIDLDPRDPFDFYLEHYKQQLVAGYTKTTPTFGLRSYFRDYNKLTAKQKSIR